MGGRGGYPREMKILLIDTCGATGSIAIAETDPRPAIVADTSLPGRTASERLVPAIKALAAHTNVGLKSLAAIVVVSGPGSFTGVRIGLSAAKGLCAALDVPLVAISRLAVLAHLAAPWPGARVYALLDAGRGEFYLGVYADGAALQEAMLTRAHVLAAIGSPSPGPASPNSGGDGGVGNDRPAAIVVACEPAVAEALASLDPRLVAGPGAADALPLALRRIQNHDFDDPATLDANYLRRTDAEIFAKPVAAKSAQPAPQKSAAPVR